MVQGIPDAAVWSAGALVVLAVMVYLLLRRRAMQPGPRLRRILDASCEAWVRDLVIPDGLDGHIHIAHLLRTAAGFVVVDVVRVTGAVFGAPNIDEWTVIIEGRSRKFRNPVAANRARRIAVSGMVPTVPVHGVVVLLGAVEFPKGVPEGTATLDTLRASLEALPARTANANLDEAWYGIASASRGK